MNVGGSFGFGAVVALCQTVADAEDGFERISHVFCPFV